VIIKVKADSAGLQLSAPGAASVDVTFAE